MSLSAVGVCIGSGNSFLARRQKRSEGTAGRTCKHGALCYNVDGAIQATHQIERGEAYEAGGGSLRAGGLLMAVLCVTPAAADLDTGMEGLWTGSDAGGEMTLLLGSGGTFISIYQADDTYQQAGVFTTDQDNMYLTMTDGSTSTLQYGFAKWARCIYPARAMKSS